MTEQVNDSEAGDQEAKKKNEGRKINIVALAEQYEATLTEIDNSLEQVNGLVKPAHDKTKIAYRQYLDAVQNAMGGPEFMVLNKTPVRFTPRITYSPTTTYLHFPTGLEIEAVTWPVFADSQPGGKDFQGFDEMLKHDS
jgi:hypothetical protein